MIQAIFQVETFDRVFIERSKKGVNRIIVIIFSAHLQCSQSCRGSITYGASIWHSKDCMIESKIDEEVEKLKETAGIRYQKFGQEVAIPEFFSGGLDKFLLNTVKKYGTCQKIGKKVLCW